MPLWLIGGDWIFTVQYLVINNADAFRGCHSGPRSGVGISAVHEGCWSTMLILATYRGQDGPTSTVFYGHRLPNGLNTLLGRRGVRALRATPSTSSCFHFEHSIFPNASSRSILDSRWGFTMYSWCTQCRAKAYTPRSLLFNLWLLRIFQLCKQCHQIAVHIYKIQNTLSLCILKRLHSRR